jgi:hypothetical protein
MIKYLAIYILILFFSTPSQSKEAEDYKIKALWIKAISENIIWHKDVDKKRVICTLGLDFVGLYLRELGPDNITIKEKSKNQELNDCHLLYISLSEERHLLDILKQIKNYNIITISDISNFSKFGGTVEFIFENNLIRLRINGKNISRLEKDTLNLDSYIIDVSEVTDSTSN